MRLLFLYHGLVQRAFVLIVVIALAACTAPAPPTPLFSQAPSINPALRGITVIANWTGAERDAFLVVLEAFTAETGIPVAYESARDNLEPVLRSRIASGNPPDIAMEPRPGAMAEFARAGNLVQLDRAGAEVIRSTELNAAFSPSFIELGKVDGKLFGLIFKADSKSTFWYKPSSFRALGVHPPKTWDDLFVIADKYRSAGQIPFAVGGKDGWVLTDHFENILARVATPQLYHDLHVTHWVAWTHPSVKKALTLFTRFFQAGYVSRKSPGVLAAGFADSIAQVYGPNASAYMLFEGGFVGAIAASTFRDLELTRDIDFFGFPQIDQTFGDPIIGGGDYAILLKDSPGGRALVRYLAGKEAAEVFAGTDNISPNRLVDPKRFKSLLRAKEFQMLTTARTFLFDGSDQAPSALGGDFEFTKLSDLVQHPTAVDRIASELEEFARNVY